MIPTCTPDVVLMDLNLGAGMSGVTAIEHIHARYPAIALLVVTMFDDDQVFAAIRAGARGYIVKDTDPGDAVRAIHTVSRGEAIFSPGIAERVLQYLTAPPPRQTDLFPDLTAREREILTLLARGYTNQAIATHLHLSDKTIRNQVSSIYSKLQVANRASAIILAREHGFGTDPPPDDV